MKGRLRTTDVAVLLGVVALATALVFWWNQPAVLRVLVPRQASGEQRLFNALAEVLRRESAGIRLDVIPVDAADTAVDLVEQNRAELAVVRLDAAAARSLQAVAVLLKEVAVLVTPYGSDVENIGALSGKALGIVRNLPANERVARDILTQSGLVDGSVALVPLAGSEVASAIRERRVAAVLLIGPPSQRVLQSALADIIREGRGEPTIRPVEITEAVMGRSARYQMTEVPRGTFGGNPPRPAEAFNTATATLRLLARPDVPPTQISELLEVLLASRQRLVAMDNPVAALIEPPDAEASAVVPIHRGAAAQLNGEKRGFLDRYSDWFYFILFVASILGSTFAGLMSFGSNRERVQATNRIGRLARLIAEARAAGDHRTLDRIEDEASAIVTFALEYAAQRLLDRTDGMALQIGIEELRQTVARARRELDYAVHLRAAE